MSSNDWPPLSPTQQPTLPFISFPLEWTSLQRQTEKNNVIRTQNHWGSWRWERVALETKRVWSCVLSHIILFRIMTLFYNHSFPSTISHWPLVYQVTLSKRFFSPSSSFPERPKRGGQAQFNFFLYIHLSEDFYQVSPKQIQMRAKDENKCKIKVKRIPPIQGGALW